MESSKVLCTLFIVLMKIGQKLTYCTASSLMITESKSPSCKSNSQIKCDFWLPHKYEAMSDKSVESKHGYDVGIMIYLVRQTCSSQCHCAHVRQDHCN